MSWMKRHSIKDFYSRESSLKNKSSKILENQLFVKFVLERRPCPKLNLTLNLTQTAQRSKACLRRNESYTWIKWSKLLIDTQRGVISECVCEQQRRKERFAPPPILTDHWTQNQPLLSWSQIWEKFCRWAVLARKLPHFTNTEISVHWTLFIAMISKCITQLIHHSRQTVRSSEYKVGGPRLPTAKEWRVT